jgi:hypothetical protein
MANLMARMAPVARGGRQRRQPGCQRKTGKNHVGDGSLGKPGGWRRRIGENGVGRRGETSYGKSRKQHGGFGGSRGIGKAEQRRMKANQQQWHASAGSAWRRRNQNAQPISAYPADGQ